MIHLSPQLYTLWRQERFSAVVFQETITHLPPPENLLQAIWRHQRLVPHSLHTLDGCAVRILHPGFLNRESGPDFKSAVIQFGNSPACSGDVEVDVTTQNWHNHHHDINPAFKSVILHVVWVPSPNHQPSIKTLVLKGVLDSPLAELNQWLDSKEALDWPENLAGSCQKGWQQWDINEIKELLNQAALVRMQVKAHQFEARARQVGWEQVLWEGLFRALGYKNNAWPMQRIAEALPIASIREKQIPLVQWQARLLGLARLLPSELKGYDVDTQAYLMQLWEYWWRESNDFCCWILPENIWQMHGQRPANHPLRRLALAAQWLHNGHLYSKLEQWLVSKDPLAEPVDSLLKILEVTEDDYWSHHWTFRSQRSEKSHPMLGGGRVTDLAVNVILPWLWCRAVAGKNTSLQQRIEDIYLKWPPAESNAVLRMACNRLFGRGCKLKQASAAMQQGINQVVRDFCNHSNACCEQCKLPDYIARKSTVTLQ